MTNSQLNKLLFVGNMSFLLAMLMRYYPLLQGTVIESTILIMGLLLSPLLNLAGILFNIRYWSKQGKPSAQTLPIINTVFLILQVFLLVSGILTLNNSNS